MMILKSKIVKQVKCCISIKGLKSIGNLNDGTEQQHISVHIRPLISVTRPEMWERNLTLLEQANSNYTLYY